MPAYYAVIPANVRYDKTVSSTAKLLYGEITALTEKEGFCWASNSYFSNLYECSIRNIQLCLSMLSKAGYIRVEIVDQDKRKIYLYNEVERNKLHGGMKKTSGGHEENFTPPHEKNFTHNKTLTDVDNTTLNNTIAPAKKADASVDLVPSQPDPDKELYQSIQQAFLAKNGNKFTNYPKEAQGTKGIIAKCKARNPNDPAGMAQAMIEKLWQLKSGSDKFYSSQPFLPSTLNASGIWDRVLEQYRDHSEQEGKAKDLVSSFYRREE